MNSREFKYEDTNAVYYETQPFSIQTHNKNITKKKKINVEVGNGFQT